MKLKFVLFFSVFLSLGVFAETYVCQGPSIEARVYSIGNDTSPGINILNRRTNENVSIASRDIRLEEMFELVYTGVSAAGSFYNLTLQINDVSGQVGASSQGIIKLNGRYANTSVTEQVNCIRGNNPLRR